MGDSSSRTGRIILVIASILVLSALGFFSTKYFSEKETSRQSRKTIDDLENEILQIEEQVHSKTLALQESEQQLTEKDNLLKKKSQELEVLLGKLNEAKQENRSNLARIRQLEERLGELKRILEESSREIEYYKAQNQQLSTQVETLAASSTRLATENQQLISQNQTTARELSETRQIAAVLKTKDFRYFNVRKSGREKPESEFRKLGLYNLRICFTVLDNLIAAPGEKTAYLVYDNPDGSTNTNFADGISGKFTYENRERIYSAKTVFFYDNLSQEVCVFFQPEKEKSYQTGPQYISVYCDGHLIGQSSFIIK
ncbi:MAG: hypothetical protein NW241_09835 [Bacteroidia bacterium]|nr:hypothetical protein [Bacteroidia bacterium]